MRLRFHLSLFSRRRKASAHPPARRGVLWRLHAKRGALILWCFIILSGTAFAAIQWRRVGTVSGTLTANQLCKNDGLDIICDSTTPYVDSSGRVGIGTTSLSDTLNVYASAASISIDSGSHVYSIMNRGTSAHNNELLFKTNGSVTWAAGLQDSTNNFYLSTGPNTGQRLTVTPSGLVGIGTTSPAAILDVNGSASLRLGTDLTTTGSQNNVSVAWTSALRYSGAGAATFTGLTAGANGQVLYLHNASASTLTLSNQSASSTAANRIITGTGADLSVPINASVSLQYDSTDSRWRVTGSSNSANTLAAGSTGQVQFNGGTNLAADSNFTWDNTNKRLGIGTASPSYAFDVETAVAPASTGYFQANIGGTLSPSSSVTNIGGVRSNAVYNPGVGVTITNVKGLQSFIQTGSAGGTITNTMALNAALPVYGSVLPTTAYGIYVNNQGAAGVTTSVGLNVAAQSGATNNYAALFEGGNVGIGTTTPSNILSFGGDAARTVGMERGTVAATAGYGLTLQAGGATSGSTNKNGGDLVLSSGVATGTGSSGITFKTHPAGSTGTVDTTASTAMTITGAGNVGVGTATPATGMKADINGPLKVAGSGSETCSASTYGAMRYNAAGYFEICSP